MAVFYALDILYTHFATLTYYDLAYQDRKRRNICVVSIPIIVAVVVGILIG